MVTVKQLDDILDAIWYWEYSRYGPPKEPHRGRCVFEATIELQEWLLKKERGEE